MEALVEAVKKAYEASTPIRIRGNGHSMNGSSLPRSGENLIQTEDFSHFHFGHPNTVTVGAGVAVWDVERFLRRYGYRLPVLNDGGKPASTIGGYLSAGGLGSASAIHGGFWETVVSVTLVSGEGKVFQCRPEDAIFPWLFGSMGQLGVIYEVTLTILPLDDATQSYPAGVAGYIGATQADWEKIAWFTLFAPQRLQNEVLDLLADLQQRHKHVWKIRPAYLYNLAFKTFNPPLIHASQETLIAAGIWGTPLRSDKFDAISLAALESDIIVMSYLHPELRRYLQTELSFNPDALRLNLGQHVYSAFQDLKGRLDPKYLFTPGILTDPSIAQEHTL
ncbi:FAD-binding oxidoreductase [Pseudovibrio denitrificans]|uniref:FAD-binding oxidoreductase n=1 Tax=Pseudovibrio denitrificans TaxID=258256 RepID=UPI00142897F7|nr:FAD-binding oxidoreductase [Pseudovibrio denitrificans]